LDLRSVERTVVSGVFFRHVPAGGAPLFRPEHPADGRWQRGEVVEGFYLAGDEQTAWGEWYRALAELAIPPMRQMPRDLWRFDVRLEGVADLSTAEKLEAVCLPLPVPSRSQWPRFQAVGEALASDGWPGIVYPSAARAGSKPALCLFRREIKLPGIRPLGPPARHDEPPAPPSGLRT
jgi:RES domain-containing protein